MHLAKSGGEAAHARRDALAYAAGAVVGTGALGAALLAIRAGGSAAGWAFQLQDPRTIMLLMLLSVAITANLLGLFQLPVLAGRARPSGGFATGALAAFVATPCAGPFLGAALGTALLLPPAGSVLVFAALGLGLAIPFLAVGFVPAFRRSLPKPGPWMVQLQRFLAIPMAATAAACLWLLWRQAGLSGFWTGIAAAFWLVVCLYAYGRTRTATPLRRGWVLIVLGLIQLPYLVLKLPNQSPTAATRPPIGAERWELGKAEVHVAEGRPVFVYFTADWCLTCKANEVTAIDRDDVRAEFKKAGVKVLAGDWTNGDPAITRFLESRGRAGVPLYLWYRPGAEPEELPQILTASMLISRARSRP
jgi:thiol:disulfide interchange protein